MLTGKIKSCQRDNAVRVPAGDNAPAAIRYSGAGARKKRKVFGKNNSDEGRKGIGNQNGCLAELDAQRSNAAVTAS